MTAINRRRFMQALGAGGLTYALGRTSGTVWAQAAGLDGFGDYRALVCVFLLGGNDSWNTIVPLTEAEYNAYSRSRQQHAIARDRLLPVTPIGTGSASFGFHPSMSGMQGLFEAGRCAAIANIGPLVEPVTKEQYKAGTARLPPQLFSHNDQQDQWHTLRGRRSLATGWAGRVADLLAGQVGGVIPVNVSLSGNTLFQAGDVATSYVMGEEGAVRFAGFGRKGSMRARQISFENIARLNYDSVYARSIAAAHSRALNYAETVNAALEQAPVLATPFAGNSRLSTQLKTVARMIAVRESLGMTRQIFFVGAGGFDTHGAQITEQPALLDNVSTSLASFYQATVELGVASNVTTFTQSDFGRSLTSNGDGTDHAWSGVQFVIGDAVVGRKVFGTYPVLELGGIYDVGGGRLIPTVSSDQYVATLAKWFGVSDAQLPAIAPSLDSFAQRDLGFMV